MSLALRLPESFPNSKQSDCHSMSQNLISIQNQLAQSYIIGKFLTSFKANLLSVLQISTISAWKPRVFLQFPILCLVFSLLFPSLLTSTPLGSLGRETEQVKLSSKFLNDPYKAPGPGRCSEVTFFVWASHNVLSTIPLTWEQTNLGKF